VYTVAAILYYAITAIRPPRDTAELIPPSTIRPVTPAALERVILRALKPDPDQRYLTAAEMLENFMLDAGEYEAPQVSLPALSVQQSDDKHWEARLRRALGDDYELLGSLGSGGFGRV